MLSHAARMREAGGTPGDCFNDFLLLDIGSSELLHDSIMRERLGGVRCLKSSHYPATISQYLVHIPFQHEHFVDDTTGANGLSLYMLSSFGEHRKLIKALSISRLSWFSSSPHLL